MMRRFTSMLTVAWLFAGCTAVAPDPARGELRVVIISDLNSAYGATSYEPRVGHTIRLITDHWQPDLVLAAGDLVAGQKPELSDSHVREMWAAFDSVVGRPLREQGIPFATTIGNHDGSRYPAHRRDRRLAAEHWRAPRHHPGLTFVDSTDFPFNYSIRAGDLFVLVWDASNEEIARLPALTEWVEGALSRPEATGAHMRFVLGHLPLYAVAEGRNSPGEVLAAPDSLRVLLERHRVHTYVSGHHHAYYPGRRGAVDLLHTGALGQSPRPLIGSSDEPYHTVTILDLWLHSDSVVYSTFRVDDDGARLEPVETGTLPEQIDGFNGRVLRRDLQP